MVSFTSRNPSFFSTATGLLVLAFALYGSSSPVNKRQTTEEYPRVQDIRKELYQGTNLLKEIINKNSTLTNMGITQENIDNLDPIVS